MERPRLRMGLVGFSKQEYLVALLRTRSALLHWDPVPAAEADALWINGEAARMVHEGIVSVTSPDGPVLSLDLHALNRPTFFTSPVADPAIRAPFVFDSHHVASVNTALRRCEAVLHPLVMQLALGGEIATRLPRLAGETYHVSNRGRLVAVVTMGGTVGLDLSLTPAAFEGAEWHALPKAANALPQHFLATTFAHLLWTYAMRVDADLLPPRYRSSLIHFRALPRVPQRMMKETHFLVLSELGAEPQTFTELQQNIGLADKPLAVVLTALYYAGAITTNPARATKGARVVREADSPTELRQSMFPADESQPFSAYSSRAVEERPTVPAPLGPDDKP